MNDDAIHDLQEMVRQVAATHMPFGKFGPVNFPPKGVPIYDLPYEYLAYFRRKGFPKGRLGELLAFVYQIKLDGADAMFDPLRQGAGGRTSLRQKKSRRYIKFGGGEA